MTETTATPELCGCSCRCGAPGLFPWWILFLWGILALLIGIMLNLTFLRKKEIRRKKLKIREMEKPTDSTPFAAKE